MATSFYRKMVDPFGVTGGDSLFGYKGYASKGKNSGASAWSPQPYTGYRPPRIDYTNSAGQKIEYLRPTQDLTQKLITERAQGQGVGYDPAYQAAQQALLKSQLDRRQEDEMRTAAGNISAAGLSGNAAARSATQGRVARDIGRTYGEGLSQIAIENLARANQERDVNTARLQALNASNFGQENTAANFDKDVWAQEQGLAGQAAGLNQNAYQFGVNQDNQQTSDLLKTGVGVASLAMGNPAPLAINMLAQSGQGVAPTYGTYDPNMASSGGGYRNYGPIRRNTMVR